MLWMKRGVAQLVILCFAGPALAERACTVPGFSEDDDAVEVHILAAPAEDAAILGIAPRLVPEGEDFARSAEFDITEMQNGWARVENVTSFDQTVQASSGWIYGDLIWFVAQTEKAFTAPDSAAEVVWSGENWPVARAVLDCAGEWALIRFDDVAWVGDDLVSQGEVTGWVRGICSLQETTCDGVEGD